MLPGFLQRAYRQFQCQPAQWKGVVMVPTTIPTCRRIETTRTTAKRNRFEIAVTNGEGIEQRTKYYFPLVIPKRLLTNSLRKFLVKKKKRTTSGPPPLFEEQPMLARRPTVPAGMPTLHPVTNSKSIRYVEGYAITDNNGSLVRFRVHLSKIHCNPCRGDSNNHRFNY